ncbi:MAG: response regulator transcription factor [Rubrivivax sp.]|nr:response regulator transcription factor [Rubrivivax sp.]
MKHVLIADDHAVTRRGLREIVRELYPDAQVGEAIDGDAALAQLDTQPWSLLLLDVMMPGPGILPLLTAVRERHPTMPILVLTATTEIEYVIETMRAGANGLVHKHQADTELEQAIERVTAGGHYLHADTAAALARSMHQKQPTHPHLALSERELDIFRRIALGQAIKEIAYDLGLSSKTVATYLERIRKKTGLTGRVEMARYALHNGIVD